MDAAVPYHCPKCRSSGQQAIFTSLPELRQHVLKLHFTQDYSSSTNNSVPIDVSTPITSPPIPNTIPAKLELRPSKDYRNIQGLSDPEQLAQAKRYLLKEAMKSSEENKVQIKQLNEDIKAKESHLYSTMKKLSLLAEQNENMEQEFGKMEARNNEIRKELDELKNKLLEKERLLEVKNKELADQLNYVKSIEEKEALAKDKLEKTVEKIIERAETAEKNLELMRLSAANNSSELSSRYKDFSKDPDANQRNAELQNILESSNEASNVAQQRTYSSNPEELSMMLTPNDPRQTTTPLAQVYLKSFLDKYSELKARDFAFAQAMPPFPVYPQTSQPLHSVPTAAMAQGSPYVSPYSQTYPIHPAQVGQPLQRFPTGSNNQDLPESDGNRAIPQQKSRSDRGELYVLPSGNKKPSLTEYSEEENDRDYRGGSTPVKNNLNNNNNFYSPSPRTNSNQNFSLKVKGASNVNRSLAPSYYDDDDDDPLTDVSEEMEEDEEIVPSSNNVSQNLLQNKVQASRHG